MNSRYVLSFLLISGVSLSLQAQKGKDVKAEKKPVKKIEKVVPESPVADHQTRLYFPIIVSKDLNNSVAEFARAAEQYEKTHNIRQSYFRWFIETYPQFEQSITVEKSALPGTQTAISIYRINSRFIRAVLQDTTLSQKGSFPPIIDSLIFHDAFLGGDLASDITSKKMTQAEKDALEFQRLTAASKPKLDPAVAKQTEGDRSRESKMVKDLFVAKAKNRDAIFIEQSTFSPVFLEPDLLAQGAGDIEERVYEFAFRWMIFANAYPDLYQGVSPKVKEYIYNNNWHALFHYCRENLNPSSYQDEVNYLLNSNNL